MKKFLILALSAALVLSIFAGCRRNVSDSTDGMIDDATTKRTTEATRNTEPRHTSTPTHTTEPSTHATRPSDHSTQPSTHGAVNTEPDGTGNTGNTDATGGARHRGRMVPGDFK